MQKQLEKIIHEEKANWIRTIKNQECDLKKLKSDFIVTKYLIIEVYNPKLRKFSGDCFLNEHEKECYQKLYSDISSLNLSCYLSVTKTIYTLLIQDKLTVQEVQKLFSCMREDIEEILSKLP